MLIKQLLLAFILLLSFNCASIPNNSLSLLSNNSALYNNNSLLSGIITSESIVNSLRFNWEIYAPLSAPQPDRALYEYRIDFIDQNNIITRLNLLSVEGWEVVTLRRAINVMSNNNIRYGAEVFLRRFKPRVPINNNRAPVGSSEDNHNNVPFISPFNDNNSHWL
jgi:hypothetical protein